jgi:polar amino acid transport system substrate-binding protein
MRGRGSLRGRSWATALFAVAVLATCVVAAASSSSARQAGTNAEELKVGMTFELPPQNYLGAGAKRTGFEYDMFVAVAKKLGYEPKFVKTPFEQAFVGLETDKYRVFSGGVYITCQRIKGAEGTIAFTAPLYAEDQVITVKDDLNGKVHSLADLNGKSLALESKGSTADAVATTFLKKNPNVKFSKDIYANVTDQVLALEQGRNDAMLQASIVTLWNIKGRKDLHVVASVPNTAFPVGFVFKKGDPLLKSFNGAINTLKKDGTLTKIWTKWFGPPSKANLVGRVVPSVTSKTCITR